MGKPNNTHPPWSEAPPWAKYRAQDLNSDWWWFQTEPKQGATYAWWNAGGKAMQYSSGSIENPNWKTTLQKRPDDE